MARFGLLGEHLGHSWSPRIHAQLGSSPYELIELSADEFSLFIAEGDWDGLNVTVPYKRLAAEAADERSERVEALGAANTLVRRSDGTVFAENTDVMGFELWLRSFCAERLSCTPAELLDGEPALVLGTGGAAQAAAHALEAQGARVGFVSRTGELDYENMCDKAADAVLIVNATPVGMYPNCPASPLPEGTLERFGRLKGVLDLIYNPRATGLCLDADMLGVPWSSGLPMLVWQAFYASGLFQGRTLDEGLVPKIIADIESSTENIALIGMPGSGKSSAGRRLAHLMGRPFVDIDDVCTIEQGREPARIITQDGEDAFRAIESELLARYGAQSGLIIACGGGVVERDGNLRLLRQNSAIVMLERELDGLSVEGRPISQAAGLEALAARRLPLYRAWADFVLPCTGSAAGDAEAIEAWFRSVR